MTENLEFVDDSVMTQGLPVITEREIRLRNASYVTGPKVKGIGQPLVVEEALRPGICSFVDFKKLSKVALE